ncbi:unnamed protein product [Strongylus vulgaris]|uniref:Uncharacterized protein n=1 Tax=Strongylus vulgaris TaxID=40348 RepID=A0A3P7M418_STRVU|nr:unnamed protein product [Strongylus vulgaris]
MDVKLLTADAAYPPEAPKIKINYRENLDDDEDDDDQDFQ